MFLLNSTAVKTALDALVTAGAITSAQETAILEAIQNMLKIEFSEMRQQKTEQSSSDSQQTNNSQMQRPERGGHNFGFSR